MIPDPDSVKVESPQRRPAQPDSDPLARAFYAGTRCFYVSYFHFITYSCVFLAIQAANSVTAFERYALADEAVIPNIFATWE